MSEEIKTPTLSEEKLTIQDIQNELVSLRATVKSYEHTQRSANITVRIGITILLFMATGLIGWNAYNAHYLSQKDKEQFEGTMTTLITARMVGVKSELITNILQQSLSQSNAIAADYRKSVADVEAKLLQANDEQSKSIMSLQGASLLQLGSSALVASNYLDGAVAYIIGCSFADKVGNEQGTRDSLAILTKEFLPHLNANNLRMRSRLDLKNTIREHFQNLINQIQQIKEKSRYALPLAELQNMIEASEQRN